MNPYIVLVCPACGGKTSLRQETTAATCDYCGSQLILRPGFSPAGYSPPGYLPGGYSPAQADSSCRPERPPAPLPERLKVKDLPDGFLITRRWFTPAIIFMTLFAVVWDGFLLFWYGAVVSAGAPTLFVLFPLLHVAVGLGITYYVLCGYVNSTYIELSRGQLIIEHYPLPWPGNRRIPVAELDQLYTKEVIKRSKNGASTSYSVCVVDKSGRKIDLVTGLPDTESGLYIEQQVESHLRIADRPIAGELPR
jgi:DNA-directed RNA polymerase subunit RPC12/RpoP